jgi:hypothetical protein
MSCKEAEPVAIEVRLGSVDFNWWEDPIEIYLTEQGLRLGIDGVCASFRTRWEDDGGPPSFRPAARNRFYDSTAYAIVGFPKIDPSVKRNDLARELMLLCFAHGHQTGCFAIDQILWAPGLYGPCFDAMYEDYWLRPLTEWELFAKHSRFTKNLSDATTDFVKNSGTGLFCFDTTRLRELRNFARALQRNRIIRHSLDGKIRELPCRYDDDVWNLIQYVQDSSVENLSTAVVRC